MEFQDYPPSPTKEQYDSLLLPSKSNDMKAGRIQTVEGLFAALGNPGLFSKLVFFVLSLNMLTIASNHAAGVFLDYTPSHTCHANSHLENVSAQAVDGISQVNVSECTVSYTSGEHGNVTENCRPGQWKYDIAKGESSSVTEWDLVCNRAGMAHLSSTLYYVGVMLGGLVFGCLSDVLGRRYVLILTVYLSVGLGVAIAFTHNLVVYIILRAIMGLVIQGFLTATYIRLLELFGPKWRGFSGNALYAVWALSLNYLGLMAWLLGSWRFIQLACVAQSTLAMIYLWFVPESLRWLLAKGKVNEAINLTSKIYRLNGCTDSRCLEPSLMSRLAIKKETKSSSFFDLFSKPTLRRRTILLCYVTLATNLGYWGLTYNTQALVGDRIQNFMLGTIPEVFLYFINIFVLNRFGRKRPMMVYFTVTATCSLVSCLLITVDVGGMGTAVTVLATIGRLTAGGLMGTNDVFMAEQYPTVVRNTGVGVCVFVGRFGAVLTPIIISLTDDRFKGLPFLAFGVVTLLAVFATMLLPSTWKKDLPETLRDLEMTINVEVEPGNDILLLEKSEEKKESIS